MAHFLEPHTEFCLHEAPAGSDALDELVFLATGVVLVASCGVTFAGVAGTAGVAGVAGTAGAVAGEAGMAATAGIAGTAGAAGVTSGICASAPP